MLQIAKISTSVCLITLAAMIAGCASEYKKEEKAAAASEAKPVNCATAQADLRTLNDEKISTAKQAAAGVTAVVPIGLVAGLVTGTEGTKAKMGTGEYNKALDAKIAQIKQTCNIS
jgi:hypothetical protein